MGRPPRVISLLSRGKLENIDAPLPQKARNLQTGTVAARLLQKLGDPWDARRGRVKDQVSGARRSCMGVHNVAEHNFHNLVTEWIIKEENRGLFWYRIVDRVAANDLCGMAASPDEAYRRDILLRDLAKQRRKFNADDAIKRQSERGQEDLPLAATNIHKSKPLRLQRAEPQGATQDPPGRGIVRNGLVAICTGNLERRSGAAGGRVHTVQCVENDSRTPFNPPSEPRSGRPLHASDLRSTICPAAQPYRRVRASHHASGHPSRVSGTFRVQG
jgi:hypothetical protein